MQMYYQLLLPASEPSSQSTTLNGQRVYSTV